MKYVFISYYFPPDYGAGSFRSESFLKFFSKKIHSKDEIHIITTYPNRYNFKKKIKKKIKKKNIFLHRIKIPNHKERFFLKSMAGFVYLIYSLIALFKIKPDYIISSSARMVSGLIAFIYSKLFKIEYFIDLRDLFSILLKEIYQKNFFIKLISKFFFSIEKKILLNAKSVNLVSPGFKKILIKKKACNKNTTFFTNGYDQIFVKLLKNSNKNKIIKKKIIYAGNVGLGQSIENLLPQVAERNKNYSYEVIGDGGRINQLKKNIKILNLKNIKIIKPMTRSKLIKKLITAEILLVNLGNYKALENVIPSKIFEYILFKKPILAGMKGFIKKYSKKNFDNIFFYNNSDECYKMINFIFKNKKKFIYKKNYEKFSREKIMFNYSNHLYNLVKQNV